MSYGTSSDLDTQEYLLQEIAHTIRMIKKEYRTRLEQMEGKEEGCVHTVLDAFREWYRENKATLMYLLTKGRVNNEQGILFIHYRYGFLQEELDYQYPRDLLLQLDALKNVLNEWIVLEQ